MQACTMNEEFCSFENVLLTESQIEDAIYTKHIKNNVLYESRKRCDMNYLFIGLMVSVGWHVGKLVYSLSEEIIFSRLHATEWYAILCKKQEKSVLPMKSNCKKMTLPYKETSMGFRVS